MADAPAMPTTAEDQQRMRFRRALSRKRRKDREAAGEIRELNITAMMDMMTIILVFLLKSYTTSAVSLTSSEELRPPVSTTRLIPRDTVTVTITARDVMVGDRKVVELSHGQVPPSALSGRVVTPLDAALRREVDKLKYIAKNNPAAPFSRELSVIADRKVPYDLLLTVLYTAGRNELENYRFIVLQKEPAASSAE